MIVWLCDIGYFLGDSQNPSQAIGRLVSQRHNPTTMTTKLSSNVSFELSRATSVGLFFGDTTKPL
jgi:hypothetical protein